jgi:hypothetical protein
MKSILAAPLVCAALCAFLLLAFVETVLCGRAVLTDTGLDREDAA